MAWHAILQHGEKIIFKVKCVKKRTLKEINKKKIKHLQNNHVSLSFIL